MKETTEARHKNGHTVVESWSGISIDQLYLFNKGLDCQAYNIMGAHPYCECGVDGYRFSCWAPNAKKVSVVGDYNGWDITASPMKKIKSTGVWYAFIPDMGGNELYKFAITDKSGELHYKADPYAFYSELRPGTASRTKDIGGYKWGDRKWQNAKQKSEPYDKPMLIYEMHLGSWKRGENGELLTYSQLAEKLVPYLIDMGYTHVEFMPVAEHPFDGSWGYQITGYYSATGRYGEPHELMYLVDMLHQNNIAVILDWVPAHFPRDAHGLRMFDGTPAYEYADPRMGEHKEWGTLVFNYARSEVLSFLISNAFFWLEMYHIDGLRVDAVSSMLYRDYNRKDGEWLANKYGGRENFEAVEFLKTLNKVIFSKFPNTLMIAEESTSWPKITSPVHEDGLGFNYKWNMGWMNDTLKYTSMDPFFRKFNHSLLTFLMFYAFSENFILPLSHDEVVHGKRSLVDKMYGSYDEKFMQLKMYYAYMMAHPGKKLLFMGGEFGQFIEWRDTEELEWFLLDFATHRNLKDYVRNLNKFYKNNKAFWQIENDWSGFKWINANDENNSVISFLRQGQGKGDYTIVVCNFTPNALSGYVLGAPASGEYEAVLHSDDSEFGGNTALGVVFHADKSQFMDFPASLTLDISPHSTMYLRKRPARKKPTPKKVEQLSKTEKITEPKKIKKETKSKKS